MNPYVNYHRIHPKIKISAVIPAYNEEESITKVVGTTLKYVDEVIVVDDGSTDKTSERAIQAGARVIREHVNKGVLQATRRGIGEATGDIIITLDGDGQHNPEEIPKLIKPIICEEADLVMGKRSKNIILGERIITAFTNFKVQCGDACSGFRAIRKEIAQKMGLYGVCLCGTFVLEGSRLGARVVSIPISIREREYGDKKIDTKHIKQFFWVLYDILRF